MRAVWTAAILAAILAGCSGDPKSPGAPVASVIAKEPGDPVSSRLAMGDSALAVGNRKGAETIVFQSDNARPDELTGDTALVSIAVGTRLRVVSDDGESESPKPGQRKVMVLVLEGPQDGISGLVLRNAIRPAR